MSEEMQNTIRKFIIKEKEAFLIFLKRKMTVQNLYFSRTRTAKKGKQRTMEKERKKKAKKKKERKKRAKRFVRVHVHDFQVRETLIITILG